MNNKPSCNHGDWVMVIMELLYSGLDSFPLYGHSPVYHYSTINDKWIHSSPRAVKFPETPTLQLENMHIWTTIDSILTKLSNSCSHHTL